MDPALETVSSDRRNARHQQFLDVAADLVRTRGLGAMTMERLAEEAGVSKALPYRYFDNADAVFVALYQREIGGLMRRITNAVERRKAGTDAIAAAVHEYFEAVSERGDLLASLAGTGSPIPDLLDGTWRGPGPIVAILTREYGVRGRKANVLSSIVVGSCVGATDSVGRGETTRAVAEKVTIAALTAAVAAVAES